MNDAPRLPDSIETIPGALAFWADAIPDAPALIVPRRPPLTYAGLAGRVEDLADALCQRGVGRGDRVAILLPDGLDFAIALLAAMRAAIAVPLGAALPAAELGAGLTGLRARVAIVPAPFTPERAAVLADAGLEALPLGTFSNPSAAGDGARPIGVAGPQGGEVAVISYTSGTTGNPKRIPRIHAWIGRSCRRHRDDYGLTCRDRAVSVTPLALSLGHWNIFHVIASGGAMIFPRSTNPADVWEAIVHEHPTWLQTAAGWLELLAAFLGERPDLSAPPSLRFVRVTSAAISPAVCDDLALRLGAPILPSYSTSETGQIAVTCPPPVAGKPGSAGHLVREVRFVDETGRDVPPGREGEIWVRREPDFLGYLDDAERNAAAFTPDGWYRTGDVGFLDEDRFLFLTGRLDEQINRGGAKIAPREVDDALLTHPAIAAAAAFAVPHARLGEDVVAAVVLKQGWTATPRELRQWLLAQLAPHKVPRRIWFITTDELPRTPTGKVRRGELAARFLQTQD